MNVLPRLLQRRSGRPRGLAWIAASVWVNLAMLPCMLFAAGAPACPGCPPDHLGTGHAEAQGHPPGHGHAAHAAEETAGENTCGHDTQDCCDDVRMAQDERSKTPTKPGKGDLVAAGLPVIAQPHRLDAPRNALATGPPEVRVSSRRLHVINCVYLN